MATYRAYFIDATQHIRDRRDIEANDDGEAVATALTWLNGEVIEVWHEAKLIADLKPPKKRSLLDLIKG